MKAIAKILELLGIILSIGSLFMLILNMAWIIVIFIGLIVFAAGRIARSLAE
jgi:hypothetical protein